MNNSFEVHLLSSDPLPIIFHPNVVVTPHDLIDTNWHRNIEILLFLEGSGTVSCADVDYFVSAGDMFIINSNYMHCIMSQTLISYHCLIVDYSFLKSNDIALDNITFIPVIKDNTASMLFNKISEEYLGNSSHRNPSIRAQVLSLMVHLMRNHISNQSHNSSSQNKTEAIKFAIGYILSHLGNKMTLDEIALQSGMSKYHMLREFKKQTGYTPIEYINIMRCENAKQMLALEVYSIDEIASAIGFKNTSYFSQTFKKYVGCSPSQYIQSK